MRVVSVSLGVLIGLVFCLASATGDEPEPAKLAFRKVEMAFKVPDPGYSVWITEIRKVGDEVWVRGEVTQRRGDPDRVFPQVISEVKASLSFRLPDLPLKYVITGKSWNWANEEQYTFVGDLKAEEGKKLMERFRSGEDWFSVGGRDR